MNLTKYKLSSAYIMMHNINFFSYYLFLLIIIGLSFLILFVPYYEKFNYTLYVDNGYKLIVDDNYFPISSNKLYIENNKYSYNILEISEPFISNNKKYYELTIDIKLEDYVTSKNLITISILKRKTNLFKKIIKQMKGW